MIADTTIKIIYNYSRSICKNTPLDYRDVAHNVIVKLFDKYNFNKIKHIKTYTYLAIMGTLINMMKNKHMLMFNSNDIEQKYINYTNHKEIENKIDLEMICSKLSEKEFLVFDKISQGYTRKEIGKEIGLTRNGINAIWFKMIKKLKKEKIK